MALHVCLGHASPGGAPQEVYVASGAPHVVHIVGGTLQAVHVTGDAPQVVHIVSGTLQVVHLIDRMFIVSNCRYILCNK